MAYEFKQERTVEFAETDMAGIVHFSNFFRYMESTEHAFFRSLGLTLHSREGDEMRGWARVDARCEYHRPLTYQDRVEIRLTVYDAGTRQEIARIVGCSREMVGRVLKELEEQGLITAHGKTIVVFGTR